MRENLSSWEKDGRDVVSLSVFNVSLKSVVVLTYVKGCESGLRWRVKLHLHISLTD